MSKSATIESNSEDWRSKYLDSVEKLESEEQRFRALEAILKRLISRLCIATLGLSPRLDTEIKKLQAVIKRDAESSELEQLMAPLTEAIHALDDKPATPVEVIAPTAAASASAQFLSDDTQLRATLATLLIELKRDPSLSSQSEALDAELSAPLTADTLSPMLATLTGMVMQRIQRIERAREEAQTLLAQMVSRLDEISDFVADQNQNQKQALASSESLNTQLSGEMQAMGASVEAASDLQQIRSQVRNRLDTIDKHLQDFRQREADRADAMHTKNEQMQARVTQLETEAQKLQAQLHAEQQVSLLDALTKVPNRLAYDKRIAEELQRWQRFAQPTCIAAWDIDHFKRINDNYGHKAGDRLLTIFAECLKNRMRSTDFFSRYGGEEFMMIFSGATLEQSLKLLDDMRIAVSKLGFHFRGTPVNITASCGVTELKTGDTADSVFERADKAMYQAKKDGRNRCVSA